jgi:hypothetical protein
VERGVDVEAVLFWRRDGSHELVDALLFACRRRTLEQSSEAGSESRGSKRDFLSSAGGLLHLLLLQHGQKTLRKANNQASGLTNIDATQIQSQGHALC